MARSVKRVVLVLLAAAVLAFAAWMLWPLSLIHISRLDTRDGDHMVVSRIGLTYPCIYFDEMQQLSVMELQQRCV